ncbi:carbohydrate ABC transporter permease [Acrocarpospora catenulata]|uniref:carbohydrate ABC transporter permease n=1 Tax=Acrocarpospora catenulata TaxID=2836182 RepID=UPI001BDB0193|nr:carbohydrate ABC transporter permease [Acrocarpospora catenulata]
MTAVTRHVRPRVGSAFPRRIPVHVTLVLICGLWAVPVLGLFVNSFRTAYDVTATGWWHAFTDGGALSLENYRQVLTANHLGEAFVNSLLVTFPAVSVLMCVAATAAFALARMEFPGRAAVAAGILALAVVPVQVTLAPVLRLYNGAGLAGTFAGVWLVHTGLALPFAIYLLRSFFAALPRDLFEAGELDGATTLEMFVRIALPLARPALASVAIFQIIWIWNDLLIALIFLGGDPTVAPLTVAIANLVNTSTGQGAELLTAAAFVAMSLPMLIFVFLHRFFVRGLLAGALK